MEKITEEFTESAGRYEEMLMNCRNAAAANYFIERIGELRDAFISDHAEEDDD